MSALVLSELLLSLYLIWLPVVGELNITVAIK